VVVGLGVRYKFVDVCEVLVTSNWYGVHLVEGTASVV
jgi:hypothetical protein